jgi:hypothetical protein
MGEEGERARLSMRNGCWLIWSADSPKRRVHWPLTFRVRILVAIATPSNFPLVALPPPQSAAPVAFSLLHFYPQCPKGTSIINFG